ncbi:hypothetical protein SISSUDRAFT_837705 [Sistotremastrum suecicum HHB10207 ss-3]|uniref:Uncharacterized protein n=1 Tax=Sistotremastrum suecicum HHB10207 ss-3 TaxID=1314776 RepID=A0A166CL66_9AGAM|nr:hypothetical protein SISSUDRAFT_837705 [Sistotremastrum suecicum HHB10207 ss-3]
MSSKEVDLGECLCGLEAWKQCVLIYFEAVINRSLTCIDHSVVSSHIESTLWCTRNQRRIDSPIAILIPNLTLDHEISSLAEAVLQKILRPVSPTVCSLTRIILSPTRSQLLIGTSKYDVQKILFLRDLRHHVFYQNLVKALRNWLNFCHTFCLPSAQYIILVLSIALKSPRRLVCLEFTAVFHNLRQIQLIHITGSFLCTGFFL